MLYQPEPSPTVWSEAQRVMRLRTGIGRLKAQRQSKARKGQLHLVQSLNKTASAEPRLLVG